MDDVLFQKKDNIALIERVLKKEDALFDNKEADVYKRQWESQCLLL